MKAFRIEQDGKLGRGALIDMAPDSLDPGEVTIRTRFAGLNYKDALAGLGGAPIVRRYPCNAGIEAAGMVETSSDSRFVPGDAVIVHGRGIGVSHDGGLAEMLRVPADWVMPLPAGLDARAAATLGVAGYSAALAVDRLQMLGLMPGGLPVAVSGATGGVGAFSVAMLAGLGFEVAAITSKAEAAERLRSLGAATVIAPGDLGDKPFGKALWSGGIDAAGGPVLARMLAATDRDGPVASIGNAAGIELATTVLPFILRGVTLTGINADSPMPLRQRIWARMDGDLRPPGLEDWATVIAPEEIAGAMQRLLDGKAPPRTIVAFGD